MNRFLERASITAFLICTVVQSARGQDPKPKQDARPDLTAMSLVEQAKRAEEQDRDFAKAIELYDRALEKAVSSKNADVIAQVEAFRAQAQARQAGIAPAAKSSDPDPMTCRLAEQLYNLEHFGPLTDDFADAYKDISLLGAIAVPWLEKAIRAPYQLCNFDIRGKPPLYVRALAEMSAPEGVAGLEKLLSSPDPIVRRAVAQYASPDRHRAILLRALKDPAEAVRDEAISRLSSGSDPKLFEVLSPFARIGNRAALRWMNDQRPDELLRIAASANLPATVRSNALEYLRTEESYRPDAAAIDALLAVASSQAEYTVRSAAMDVLQRGVSSTWRPFDPILARRIEEAIKAAPDSFPFMSATYTLWEVSSASSLGLMIGRTSVDDMSSLTTPISRILGRSGPADFAAVVAAFAKTPVPVRGVPSGNGNMGEWIHGSLRSWLEAMAKGEVSSVEIAKGAKVLPPAARRIYLQSVVVGWLEANTNTDAAIARLPKFDAGFLELLREMAASGDGNFTNYAIRGLGASGEAKVLPELMATLTGNSIDGTVAAAIRRIVVNDPQRVRVVLQLLLGNKTIATENFCQAFQSILDKSKSEGLLEVVNSLWAPESSERLMALVTGAVPGPAGCSVLMQHYAELDAAAFDTRMRVIQHFGQELFEPALDLIGSALIDPNDRVRNTANQVFEKFKFEQQRVNEFNEWRKGDQQSKQAIAELIPLLDNANPDVVIGAVKALRALKARACYPKLVLLLEKHKDNEKVKDVVMQTLDELGK